MAVINDVGGTSLDFFSINGGATIYQGSNIPNNDQGKNGDIYLRTDGIGDLYFKQNGSWIGMVSGNLPVSTSQNKNKLFYSTGSGYDWADVTYENGKLKLPEHPDATNDENLKEVPTIGWVNDPTKSTNVVHRTGDETINGTKTFTNNILLSRPENIRSAIINTQNTLTKGTNPSDNYFSGVILNSNDLSEYGRLGELLNTVDTNGNVTTKLLSYRYIQNTKTNASISVIYPKTGEPYATAPDPSLSSNATNYGKQIVTVGYLNGSNSNVVHRTGNEEINGEKTFKNRATFNNNIIYQKIVGANSSISDSESYLWLDLRQCINGQRRGAIRTQQEGENLFSILLGCNGPGDTSSNSNFPRGIKVYRNANRWYTSIDSSTGGPWSKDKLSNNNNTFRNQIATVGWVLDNIANIQSKTSNNDTYYYWKNPQTGLIIQWGQKFYNNNSNIRNKIVFPIPFKNTKYTVVGTCAWNGATSDGHGYISKNQGNNNSLFTTTFFYCQGVDSDMYPFHWIAIGY